jgi:hypothetical protein
MSNPIKPRPLDAVVEDMRRAGFGDISIRALIDALSRIDKVLTDAGEVQAQANITGRTEQISTTVSGLAVTGDINAATKIVGRTEGVGTTVQKLNSSGLLLDTDQIAADGTGSPLTGGKRGFSNIFADGTYNTPNYHTSAARILAATNRTGNTADNSGTFQTVASFSLTLPPQYTQYKGLLTVSKGAGGAVWTDQGRLKIGALTSNVLTFNNPATSVGPTTVTVTGLTGGTTVTVEVQVSQNADVAATITGTFVQNQYTDQDTSNLA